MKKIAVIAPDMRQFKDFLRELSSEDREKFVYVSGARDVMGMEFSDYLKVGECYKINDLYELEELTKSRIRP